MRLSRDEWEHLTEGLFVGQRIRANHACGSGTTLMVSRSLDGFRAWCFRCNAGDAMPPPQESLAEKLARLKAAAGADADVQRATAPPSPAVPASALAEWPAAAKVWLYRAGLGAAEIAQLGAYYHPDTGRVVLPVLEGGDVVYWQARSVDGRKPKYLGAATGRQQAVPRYGKGTVVITEDILSAFKVGLSGAQGWAALGTAPSPRFLALLVQSTDSPLVWLDPDAAGQRGATKILRALRSYGLHPRNVLSQRDPKLLSRKEIHEQIL